MFMFVFESYRRKVVSVVCANDVAMHMKMLPLMLLLPLLLLLLLLQLMEDINSLLLCFLHKSRAAIAATTNQHQQSPSTADDEHVVKIPYVSDCRALLIGIGPDE